MYQILAYVWKRQVERSMPKCPYASMRIKKEVIAMYIIELILKNIYVHIFRHLFSCTKTSQHQQISTDISRYQQISTDINRYQQMSTDINRYQQIKHIFFPLPHLGGMPKAKIARQL